MSRARVSITAAWVGCAGIRAIMSGALRLMNVTPDDLAGAANSRCYRGLKKPEGPHADDDVKELFPHAGRASDDRQPGPGSRQVKPGCLCPLQVPGLHH